MLLECRKIKVVQEFVSNLSPDCPSLPPLSKILYPPEYNFICLFVTIYIYIYIYTVADTGFCAGGGKLGREAPAKIPPP